MTDKKKFAIFYGTNHSDSTKAGKRYVPPPKKMVVMNSSGIFFLCGMDDYYPSVSKLSSEIGNYDVVWN
jgi:hypothetical protein